MNIEQEIQRLRQDVNRILKYFNMDDKDGDGNFAPYKAIWERVKGMPSRNFNTKERTQLVELEKTYGPPKVQEAYQWYLEHKKRYEKHTIGWFHYIITEILEDMQRPVDTDNTMEPVRKDGVVVRIKHCWNKCRGSTPTLYEQEETYILYCQQCDEQKVPKQAWLEELGIVPSQADREEITNHFQEDV